VIVKWKTDRLQSLTGSDAQHVAHGTIRAQDRKAASISISIWARHQTVMTETVPKVAGFVDPLIGSTELIWET